MKWLFAFALVMSFVPAATAQDDPLDALVDCLQELESGARLACYDAIVVDLQDAAEAESVPAASADPAAADPEPPQEAASAAADIDAQPARRARPGHIVMGVRSIAMTSDGKARITLENGQIWQQTDSIYIPIATRKNAEEAEVRRTRFGSTLMKLDGGNGFRVRRLN